MNEIKNVIFKVINGTEKYIFSWKSIKSFSYNKELQEYIAKYSDNERTMNLWENNSYYAKYKEGYVYLFSMYYGVNSDKDFYIMAAQGDIDSKIVNLHETNEFQPELIRLNNLVVRQVNNIDNFLADILNNDEL